MEIRASSVTIIATLNEFVEVLHSGRGKKNSQVKDVQYEFGHFFVSVQKYGPKQIQFESLTKLILPIITAFVEYRFVHNLTKLFSYLYQSGNNRTRIFINNSFRWHLIFQNFRLLTYSSP